MLLTSGRRDLRDRNLRSNDRVVVCGETGVRRSERAMRECGVGDRRST
jgi:hypothetical protein